MAGNEELLAWDDAVWRTASRNRTFMMPDVLSERLDALVQLLDDDGVRVTRADIVGALVLAAPADADEIDRLVRSYKHAPVTEAFIGEPEGPGLRLGTTQPGPRRRRS